MRWKPLMRSALRSLSLMRLEIGMDSREVLVFDMSQNCTRAMQPFGHPVAMRSPSSSVSRDSLPTKGWVGSRATHAKYICRRSTADINICVARERKIQSLRLPWLEVGTLGAEVAN